MSVKCYVKVGKGHIEGEYIGTFQYSNVIEPSMFVGGHNGGVDAYPVAVVRSGAKLLQVRLSDVVFANDITKTFKPSDSWLNLFGNKHNLVDKAGW